MLRLGAPIPQSKPHPPGGLASNVVGRHNMVEFFIRRPIFASAVAVIMMLAGSISYFLLPVSQPLKQQINWV